MLRAGTLPRAASSKNVTNSSAIFSIPAAKRVIHVGHSFGSALSFQLAAMYPNASDGLILTGFSSNSTWLPQTIASWNLVSAADNQPLRFGGLSLSSVGTVLNMYGLADLVAGLSASVVGTTTTLVNGYLTWSNIGANQFAFLAPPYYDQGIALFAESTKQPVTNGELLSLLAPPMAAPGFTGPVLVITGNEDEIYCGGNCTATGGAASSVLASSSAAFPNATTFQAYVHPNTGHAINVHYNATGAYNVMNKFLKTAGF